MDISPDICITKTEVFDVEFAKNKNASTYLTDQDISYKIKEEINPNYEQRNQSANLPKRTSKIVKDDIDDFLKRYKII